MRSWRSGTRSWSRSSSWASRMAIGSRPGAGSKAAWLARGTRFRAAFPTAARAAGSTHGRAVHEGPAGISACQAASYVAAVALSGVGLRGRRSGLVGSVMASAPFLCRCAGGRRVADDHEAVTGSNAMMTPLRRTLATSSDACETVTGGPGVGASRLVGHKSD